MGQKFSLNNIKLSELQKGSAVAFAIKVLGMCFGYLFTFLITRKYGAHTMGVFTLALTVLNIVAIIGKLGLDTTLVKFIAEYSSQNRMDMVKEIYMKSFRMILISCFFLGICLFFFSPYIGKYVFKKDYLTYYLYIVSISVFPFVMIFINSESLRGLKKIKEYSFIQDLSISFLSTCMLVLSFSIVNQFSIIDKINIPFIVYIISVFITFIVSHTLWRKKSKMGSISYGNEIALKSIFNVSLPIYGTSLSILFIMWMDKIILGIFRPESDVGIYTVALKIAMLTSISLLAVNSISAPKFAQFYGNDDMAALRRVAQQSTKLIFWSSAPVLILFLFFPSFFMGFFGKEFQAGANALLMLTIGQFINAITGSVGYILQMTGRQKAFQNIMFVTVIVNLTLNIILIPRFGLNGAAFSTMISAILVNTIPFILIKRYYGFYTFSPKVVFDLKREK